MTNELALIRTRTYYDDLIVANLLPFDQHPAAVYLFSLNSERSRRVMSQSLRTIAALLTGQDAQTADIFSLDWAAITYAHTAVLRTRLLEQYSPATTNPMVKTISTSRPVIASNSTST